MFINIVATITPAVMISLSIRTFEIISHEIEYINELTMTFIDVVIAISLWNSTKRKNPFVGDDVVMQPSQPSADAMSMWTTTFIAVLVAVVQLGVYNLMGYDEETHDMVGEPLGHFLEFLFEIASSLIAFLFCMDNKSVADQEISLILYSQLHEQKD